MSTSDEAGSGDKLAIRADDLAARAAAHRADGTFPAGVDDALRDDFDRELRAAAVQTTELRAALDLFRAASRFELRSYRGSSRGKAAYARVVERIVGFALRDILWQLDRHQVALDRLLTALVDRIEALDGGAGHAGEPGEGPDGG